MGYLKEAEFLHKAITTYLWLSYRFNGVFISQALAFHVKDLVEVKINQCLENINYDPRKAAIQKALREKTVKRGLTVDAELGGGHEFELFDDEAQVLTRVDVELPEKVIAIDNIDDELRTEIQQPNL